MFYPTLALGVVFLYHGLDKVNNPRGFASAFKLPLIVAFTVIAAEILAGLALLLGDQEWKTYGAMTTVPILIGAIALVHWKNGFSVMNGGWEYQFVLLTIALQLIF